MPRGDWSIIVAVVTKFGTMAVICVSLSIENACAENEPKKTRLTVVKLLPERTTLVPIPPLVGVKLLITGDGSMNVNDVPEVAVPLGVITVITPEPPASVTVAVICVGLMAVNGTFIPPNRTAVAPVKFVPEIVITAPGMPPVGVKAVMVGAGALMVKPFALVAVPPGVVTLIVPLDASAGTVTAMSVPSVLTSNKLAESPPKRTLVAPVKFVPIMLTSAPVIPLVGENPEIVGTGGMTVNGVVVVILRPLLSVMVIGPVCAPGGTSTTNCVSV